VLFIFGTRLFGKVDEVPGHFHVATEFFHIDYVPLIPVKGWIVTSQNGTGWHGVPIPISGKSVAIAWGRAIAIAAVVAAGIVMLVNSSNGRSDSIAIAAATAAIAIGACVFTYKHRGVTHASCERARELGRMAGMNAHVLARLEALFDENPTGGFPVIAQDLSEEPLDFSRAASTGAIPSVAGDVSTNRESCYFVSGTNASGQQVCITVWARDEQHAREKSAAMSISVSAVESGFVGSA